jgi:hypothetical protein
MKEHDKVEEFTNGRVGMMFDTLAHINLIREGILIELQCCSSSG